MVRIAGNPRVSQAWTVDWVGQDPALLVGMLPRKRPVALLAGGSYAAYPWAFR